MPGTPGQPPSNITLAPPQVDAPLEQDAPYEFDSLDRAYLDSQILGIQQLITSLVTNGVSATIVQLSGASAAAPVGSAVCSAGQPSPQVTLATTGALAGANVLGIVISPAAPGGYIAVATAGLLPATVTGLPGGAGYAIIDGSTGLLAFSSSPAGAVGRVDGGGGLTLSLGSLEASGPTAFVLRKTSTYVMTDTDPTDVFADTNASNFSITLPPHPYDGKKVRFKDSHTGGSWGTNSLTVAGAAGQNVESPSRVGSRSGAQALAVNGGFQCFQWGATEATWFAVTDLPGALAFGFGSQNTSAGLYIPQMWFLHTTSNVAAGIVVAPSFAPSHVQVVRAQISTIDTVAPASSASAEVVGTFYNNAGTPTQLGSTTVVYNHGYATPPSFLVGGGVVTVRVTPNTSNASDSQAVAWIHGN